MPVQWFVLHDDKELGPFSSSRLKTLAQRGQVSPDTMVRRGDSGGWVPAGKVKGLFPETTEAAKGAQAGDRDVLAWIGTPSKPETPELPAAHCVSDSVVTDEAIKRLVKLMISEAVELRASHIHVEPFKDRVRIRYRIDGALIERDSPPRRLLEAITSRIKILAKLDKAERRRPQHGRIKIIVGEKELDLRVSIIPTNHGQSIVMRILDKDNIKIGLRQLGFSDETLKKFSNLIKRPNGIILVTGPTGSGKTTTLYAALNFLNRPDRKIITAEDPVEYCLPGINQCEVKRSIGMDFARIIRAMLRQAPNIILVSEMRDEQTTTMATDASLRGHLVFSTLDTTDAPRAVTRMIDMGVPAYLVGSSVIAIMAQRLVRTVCTRCVYEFTPRPAQLQAAGVPPEVAARGTFRRGKGCDACQRMGYSGRTGIHELMVVSPRIRQMIFENKPTTDIRKVAIEEGMKTLYVDGVQKVLKGITTLEEVFRVAKPSVRDATVS